MNINIIKNSLYKKALNEIPFYNKTLPILGEMVSSEILEYSEIGITVFLKEYKKTAFMSYNESSSSRRIKTIKKQLSKNKYNILVVQNIDNEKGFIDVSKKCVNEKEQNNYIEMIKNYEIVFNQLIKSYVYVCNPSNIEEIKIFLRKTLWKIDPLETIKLVKLFKNDKTIFKVKFNLTDNIDKRFTQYLEKILPDPMFLIQIKLKISSYHIDAISILKNEITTLENKINVKIKLESGNIYKIPIIDNFKDKNSAKEHLKNVISKISDNIPPKSDDIKFKIISYEVKEQ